MMNLIQGCAAISSDLAASSTVVAAADTLPAGCEWAEDFKVASDPYIVAALRKVQDEADTPAHRQLVRQLREALNNQKTNFKKICKK